MLSVPRCCDDVSSGCATVRGLLLMRSVISNERVIQTTGAGTPFVNVSKRFYCTIGDLCSLVKVMRIVIQDRKTWLAQTCQGASGG